MMRVRAAAAVLVQNERVLGDVELDQYWNSFRKKFTPLNATILYNEMKKIEMQKK